MDEWTALVIDYVLRQGACAAGVATVETLAGGPPSADLAYVLPEAKSAVSFAVPLEQEHIRPFLSKKDFQSHEQDNVQKNAVASGIALHLADYLEQRGFASVPLAANQRYRTDTPRGIRDLLPPISLRYLAVRSGVGSFGLSGNVITKKYGAAVILGGVVTASELTPTEPVPEEENYCDQCRLCMAACPSGLMDPAEKADVRLGDMTFSYSRRRGYVRCEYVCGGFAGLHTSGKWSTWSPARFPIPETDEEFKEVFRPAAKAYWQRPQGEGGFYHPLMKTRLWQTCGHCQIVCHPDKEERKQRYNLLTQSGVVVENPDGSREVVPAEEARARMEAMPSERRALYERVE